MESFKELDSSRVECKRNDIAPIHRNRSEDVIDLMRVGRGLGEKEEHKAIHSRIYGVFFRECMSRKSS